MALLTDWLQTKANQVPDKIALIDAVSARKFTFRDWNLRVNQTAQFLRENLEIGVGDRVAVLSQNSESYLDLLFACNKLGAILQNLNWRLTLRELMPLIDHAQPKALFYGSEFTEVVGRIKDVKGLYPQMFVAFGEKQNARDLDFSRRDSFSSEALPSPMLPDDTPWVLCYTGGTTGLPKGVIITQRQLLYNAMNTLSCGAIQPGDVGILTMPMFHTAGLNCFALPLVQAGGTSIVMPTLDIDLIFDLIEIYPVNTLMGVPTIYIAMQQHSRWDLADFSGFRYIVSGGAPCPSVVMQKFWEKRASFTVGYGLTEAGPSNFYLPMNEQKQKPGSVGYALMHVETRLVNDAGMEITAPMQEGELWLRGPHCSVGYWNNIEATRALIDEEGWVHTGDIAMMDGAGAFWILGRQSDMYICGGENVYPPEVESVLIGHEDVVDACVFGVTDDYWGEVGCAVLAVRDGAFPNAEEMHDYLQDKLARYKMPRFYFFASALPKTAAGKIDKQAIRRQYEMSCAKIV